MNTKLVSLILGLGLLSGCAGISPMKEDLLISVRKTDQLSTKRAALIVGNYYIVGTLLTSGKDQYFLALTADKENQLIRVKITEENRENVILLDQAYDEYQIK